MLVDIIIPAYNPGKFLFQAIRSCFSQEYKKYTITVIDDNSTEDVKSMLKRFPTVKYIRNDKNIGPGASRNVGIKSTNGDLVSLLDADDIMHPSKLKFSVAAFRGRPDIGMTCGNYQILLNRVRLKRPFYRKPISIDHATLMRQNFVASGSTTIKREVFDEVGLFSEEYRIAEDYDMWLRISEKYSIEYIHEILYYYSVIPRGGSLTQRKDVQAEHIENIDKIKKASEKRIANE
jgi:glycosyltransferase involved in cell wall biosynthesis